MLFLILRPPTPLPYSLMPYKKYEKSENTLHQNVVVFATKQRSKRISSARKQQRNTPTNICERLCNHFLHAGLPAGPPLSHSSSTPRFAAFKAVYLSRQIKFCLENMYAGEEKTKRSVDHIAPARKQKICLENNFFRLSGQTSRLFEVFGCVWKNNNKQVEKERKRERAMRKNSTNNRRDVFN